MAHLLTDLIEPARFSERVRLLSERLGAPVGIVERDGVPLVASGQAVICRDHLCRAAATRAACAQHSRGLCERAALAAVDEVCPNGLCEIGSPIAVDGEAVGSVIIGPYARSAHLTDLAQAAAWAADHGLDASACVAALAAVPLVDAARAAQVRAAADELATEVAAAAGAEQTAADAPAADQSRGEPALRDVLDAIDELLAINDLDTLARRAVEVARERLGVERIGLFLREGQVLRGTYGTNSAGQTVDESGHVEVGGVVVEMSRPGHRGWRAADTDMFVLSGGTRQWIGTSWIGVTPMQVEGEAIGVLTNDAAISGAPLDAALQDRLAVFASLLGPLVVRLRNELAERGHARLTAALTAADSVLEIAEATADACDELFGYDCFLMAVRTADGEHLELPFVIDQVGDERVRFDGEVLPLDIYSSRLPDVVAGAARLINREPGYAGPALSAVGAVERRSQSIIFAPILLAGEFAGLVSVQSYQTSRFDQHDVRRLVRVAETVAPALGRAYATERLRRLQAHQQALLEATPDPYFVHDRDGRYVAVHAPERLRMYKLEELVGRAVQDVVDDATAQIILATVRRTIDEQTGQIVEYRLARDGREVWYEGRTAPMGEFCAWLACDITARRQAEAERRELEAQLLQATKMEAVGQLAGGVAHDFNNLLTTITGYADLLHDALAGGELEADVDEVLKAAARAGALTRQLLAFSRRQVFRREVFDLGEVVTELNGMLSRLLGADVDLVADLSAEPLFVAADRGQVEQVIVNLVVNARDSMPRGGRLTLRTSHGELGVEAVRAWPEVAPGDYVVLDVIDTGCGMDGETLAKAFEPFFTTKPRGAGTGLGLSTVYGIVHQSAGHVTCDSQVDQGTRFTVYLPRVEAAPTSAPAAPADPPPGGRETVLLVEDEPAVRALARRVLITAGYRVIEAADGQQALRLAAEADRPIDLLLTDVMMPGMNGQQLAERMQADRPGLVVLYITGYSEAVLNRRGTLAPGTQVLAKPFSPRVLLTRLRALLDSR